MRKKSKSKFEKPKKSFSLKIMKVYFVLFILGFCCTLSAVNTYSQTANVTVKLSNAKVEKLFSEIEKKSEFVILYKKGIVENKTVSVNSKNESIEGILNRVLPPLNLSYHINGNQIVVVEKKVVPEVAEVAQAPSFQSSGTIVDVNKEPLTGVSVVEKGTTNGTISDVDGKFTLKVNPNATLVISYLGFQNKELKAAANMNIILEEQPTELEDVVVVGYGIQKKANLTGAVATVDSKRLENRPLSNVSAGIAGLMPGVTVVQKGGLPGEDNGTIRVRGVGTFNNSDPMVLVDGVEATMNNLDPNDIESITVLKDAASAAIYGSKASNGVILVTTKRGKSGKATVNYSGSIGWQSATRLPDYMNSAEYGALYNEALLNDNPNNSPRFTADELRKLADGSDPDNYANTDWQNLLYKGSGFQTAHNVSASGGTDNVKYMTSIGYLNQAGIIKHAGKDQYNVRTNLDISPTSKFDIGVSLSYTRMDLEQPTNSYVGGGADQIFRQVNLIAPYIPYKKSNGDYGTVSDGNPIAWIDLDETIKKKRSYFLGIGSLQYKLLDGLTVKGVLSYKSYVEDENEFIKDIQYNPNKYHGPNKMHQKDRSNETVSTDVLLNYNKVFNASHNLGLMGGFHSEYYHEKYTYAYRQNFPNNEVTDINAGSELGAKAEGYTRELSMLSWFGRVNYDYKGKYLLEANFRYDGTSRFAKDNRWGFFPSFSAGWRISEEDFMESIKTSITNLKLRASWGKLGNQNALNTNYYPTVPTLVLKDQSYPFGGKIVPGAAAKDAKNANLKWESSRTWGLGVDVGILSNLNVSIDYYDRLTSDMIMEVASPETFALSGFLANLGEISNKGIEIDIQYNKKINDWMLVFGGNASYNKNEIKKLAGQLRTVDPNNDKLWRIVGQPINSIYGYRTNGLYQTKEQIANGPDISSVRGANAKPGDLIYVDVDGNGKVDGEDRVLLGSTDPKYTFGFNLGAEFKGFDLTLFFQGAAGVKGYMDSEAYGDTNGDSGKATTFWRDRWTPDNTNTSTPRVSARGKGGPSSASLYSDYWVQDATYLRLKNLQFGYTLPSRVTKHIGLSKVRFYYSGQNLLTFTGFMKGWDPEAPIGRGSHYPQVMVNSFGVNVTF